MRASSSPSKAPRSHSEMCAVRCFARNLARERFYALTFFRTAPSMRFDRRSSSRAEHAPNSYAEARYYGPPQGTDTVQSSSSPRMPLVIGVAGGTASGKTSVCKQIIKKLQADPAACGHRVLSISQDCFYRDLTPAQHASIAAYNFDHPDAFDFSEIRATLHALRAGDIAEIPTYDFVTSSRTPVATKVHTTDLILFDGILAFYDPEVRGLFDLKVFVDADADTRLARRLRRDIAQRGRSVDAVLNQYERTVKPSFESYIAPTKKFADVIVPRGAENAVAIDLLWQTIRFRIDPGLTGASADGPQDVPAHA
eukprot:jgi/Ulvmu1/9403/UM051_0031.1